MHKPTIAIALGLSLSCQLYADVPERGAGERLLGYEGRALAPDSGTLLYREEHLLREQALGPAERLVLYRCADGTLFARKRVDYSEAELAPAFELVDARLDYREGLRREDGQLLAFAGRGKVEAQPLQAGPTLVADAGFDRLVQQRWDALQAGEAVRIDFLVPSRAEALGFRLRKVEALQLDGEAASRIRLSLSGLFGLIAPDIDVIYRDRDRWLLRFEGLTNIRADSGRNLVAHIEFPEPPQARDAEAWRAAGSEPLQRCSL
jgi:hypothetical protein